MPNAVRMAEYQSLPSNPVKSSNVRDVRYNPESRRLFVSFIREGRIYAYEDVPNGTYQGFLSSESKGRYVWFEIRAKGTDSRFAYARID